MEHASPGDAQLDHAADDLVAGRRPHRARCALVAERLHEHSEVNINCEGACAVESQMAARSVCARSGGLAAAGALAVVISLAGCGSGSRAASSNVTKSPPRAAQPALKPGASETSPVAPLPRRSAPVSIKVASTARTSGEFIGSRYTCGGANISPPVTWKNVPSDAKELLVFVKTVGLAGSALNWAVAGLSPSLHGLAAGKLPSGAIVGRNSYGRDAYSVCPSQGPEGVSIGVIALPRAISVHQGFAASTLATALAQPGARQGKLLMLARK
jgi:phosphatidylethanolamine-binding protein (PEBP) family uncharacterized protein